MDDNCLKNTDRELWREKEKDFYSSSIHVTKQGEIGINVDGCVIVKPIQDWHKCQCQLKLQIDVAMGAKSIAAQLQGENEQLMKALALTKSMICCGESFTKESRDMVEQALKEPKLCICCEEITEENAHIHRNCGK